MLRRARARMLGRARRSRRRVRMIVIFRRRRDESITGWSRVGR